MILTCDTENTTWNSGNPFDRRNFNVTIQWQANHDDGYGTISSGVSFSDDVAGRENFGRLLQEAREVVFFNAKYDLHWLRKLGFVLPSRIWCTQVVEFFLGRQSPKYPDLDGLCEQYGLPRKIDVIKTEYWDKGINTHEIPRPVLAEYGLRDVESTYLLYLKQKQRVRPHQEVLISIQMQDLLTLQEIEWNGLKFDPDLTLEKSTKVAAQIQDIQQKLSLYHAVPSFNWASPAHISALLFGGEIEEIVKVPDGVFKSGQKVGQPKFRNEVRTHKLPRMYNPPRGSALKKEGQWSTDEDTLLKIKGGKKELIEGILEIKRLQKLDSTYLEGILRKNREMNWPEGYVHGQYNQVVAATGRLSSSNPNMQNADSSILDIFVTRFN